MYLTSTIKMHTSLILAITLVPVVLVLILLGLLLAWVHMRKANRADVVDLVEMPKEPHKAADGDGIIEGRKSSEPFPQLPSMNLHHSDALLDLSDHTRGKSYGNLQRMNAEPIRTDGSTPYNSLATTPPKRPTSLIESPSREALAAFDFSDTPSKPPIPTRSLKRASGTVKSETTVESIATPTPIIKIEPASPSSTFEAEDKVKPLASSTTEKASLKKLPGDTQSHDFQTGLPLATPADADAKAMPAATSNPFSAVSISHLKSPTSDDVPPTPTRAITYGPTGPFMPKDQEGLRAMMETEAWRPDLAKKLRKQKSGKSMIGKRNSAIREYMRHFPEQNPWRKMVARRSKDVHVEEGVVSGEEEFSERFGARAWQ